jgi:hypothetical protein
VILAGNDYMSLSTPGRILRYFARYLGKDEVLAPWLRHRIPAESSLPDLMELICGCPWLGGANFKLLPGLGSYFVLL